MIDLDLKTTWFDPDEKVYCNMLDGTNGLILAKLEHSPH